MGRFTPALCLAVAAAFVGGCDPVLHGTDPHQIFERWESNYGGECSSWLTSPRSGKRYCASPEIRLVLPEPPKVDAGPKFDTTKTDLASLVAAGEQVYGQVCGACHQPDGKGLPGQFPPLAGSGEYYGDAANMARIVVNGLSGEIVVQGVTYNGAMPAQGYLTDYELAAAMTYVRHSWGNNDGIVLPSDVAAAR